MKVIKVDDSSRCSECDNYAEKEIVMSHLEIYLCISCRDVLFEKLRDDKYALEKPVKTFYTVICNGVKIAKVTRKSSVGETFVFPFEPSQEFEVIAIDDLIIYVKRV